MAGEIEVIEALEARATRREDRRAFFRAVGGMAKVAGVGAATLAANAYAQTSTPSDGDILNLALNLEYLEAQFYSYAVTGAGLPAALLTGGDGSAAGAVTIETGTKAVPFTDQVVKAFAREIYFDELAHVGYLRQAAGSTAVAMPAIDISAGGAFRAVAQAAGIPPFNPYLNDENFLLAAFIFEDVGVTAYKGAAALISNKTFVDAAAGILATEAYHAGIIRTTLTSKGLTTPSLISSADAISNARDSLDGSSDDDVGLSDIGNASSVVPVDGNGLVFDRSTGQVLNVVYLSKSQVKMGGFFPKGVNGAITMSNAN